MMNRVLKEILSQESLLRMQFLHGSSFFIWFIVG